MTVGDPLLGYLVHFTRGSDPHAAADALAAGPVGVGHGAAMRWLKEIDGTGLRASLSILCDGCVRATRGALGLAADVPEVAITQRCACFSATRLDELAHLIETRSPYGVGFCKTALEAAGGKAVTYFKDSSPEAKRLERDVRERQRRGVDPDDPFWQRTPFLDIPGNDWEEEWRVLGGFRFAPDDVAFLFLPEDQHDAACAFFAQHLTDHTGPSYLCRYIDPGWDRDRIADVLTAPVLKPYADPRP